MTRRDSALAQAFPTEDSLSLNYLFEKTPYSMGMLPLFYVGSRDSRYPPLVSVIEPYLNSPVINEFHNNRNEMSVAYLDKDRADYLLRMRITHFGELKANGKEDRYKFYFLDEGRQHKLVAAACSNSELGKQVIARINELITPDFHETYLQFRQEWDPDNQRFEQTFKEYFLEGVRHEYVVE